jgi:hypothetical protein
MAIQINGDGTITGISVGGLPDGIVDTDMIAANAVTPAKSSGIGITEMDNWRINTSQTYNGVSDITSGWERNDTTFQKIGTGLSESSGVFSFPSTGKYYIVFYLSWTTSNPSNYNGGYIRVTIDGSNYTRRADGFDDVQANGGYGHCSCHLMLDVENTTTHKVKFEVESQTSSTLRGDSGRNISGFTCIRLGDT